MTFNLTSCFGALADKKQLQRSAVVEAALEIIKNLPDMEDKLFPPPGLKMKEIGTPDENIINILADQIEEALKVKDEN